MSQNGWIAIQLVRLILTDSCCIILKLKTQSQGPTPKIFIQPQNGAVASYAWKLEKCLYGPLRNKWKTLEDANTVILCMKTWMHTYFSYTVHFSLFSSITTLSPTHHCQTSEATNKRDMYVLCVHTESSCTGPQPPVSAGKVEGDILPPTINTPQPCSAPIVFSYSLQPLSIWSSHHITRLWVAHLEDQQWLQVFKKIPKLQWAGILRG